MKKIIKTQIKLEEGQHGGWVIRPVNGDIAVLDFLYGGDYLSITEEKKNWNHGESFEATKAELLDISKSQGFTVLEVSEDTFELSKVEYPPAITYNVDLKWGLWDRCEETWGYLGEKTVWNAMRDAFLGDGAPVKIISSPKKEIRSGTVVITEGKACVNFKTYWDEPCCFIPDDCPEELEDKARIVISSYFDYDMNGLGYDEDSSSPIGALIEEEVVADTFEELMEKIDKLEDNLLTMNDGNWKDFEKAVPDMMAYVKEHADEIEENF